MRSFSRRRNNATTDSDGSVPRHDLGNDDFDEAAASGPWDLSELPEDQEEVSHIDLGSLQVLTVDGMQLRLEQAPGGTITAVALALGDSALKLRTFATLRTADIRDELRGNIADELVGGGIHHEENHGEYDTELVAHLPTHGPDGTVATGAIRFPGIDGPRWLLCGVLQGPAASPEHSAQVLREMLRGIVVVRDNQARPPCEILSLHASGAVTDPEVEGLSDIDPLVPGPTTAKVHQMEALSVRVKRLYESLCISHKHLKVEDEERSVSRRGIDPIGSLTLRQRACVSDVLQVVTYHSSRDRPIPVGQPYDSTGSIDLVWWGR